MAVTSTVNPNARPSELPKLAKEKPWASRHSGRERRQKLKDSPPWQSRQNETTDLFFKNSVVYYIYSLLHGHAGIGINFWVTFKELKSCRAQTIAVQVLVAVLFHSHITVLVYWVCYVNSCMCGTMHGNIYCKGKTVISSFIKTWRSYGSDILTKKLQQVVNQARQVLSWCSKALNILMSWSSSKSCPLDPLPPP